MTASFTRLMDSLGLIALDQEPRIKQYSWTWTKDTSSKALQALHNVAQDAMVRRIRKIKCLDPSSRQVLKMKVEEEMKIFQDIQQSIFFGIIVRNEDDSYQIVVLMLSKLVTYRIQFEGAVSTYDMYAAANEEWKTLDEILQFVWIKLQHFHPSEDNRVEVPPLKCLLRYFEKLIIEYGDDPSSALDVLRGKIQCANLECLHFVLRVIITLDSKIVEALDLSNEAIPTPEVTTTLRVQIFKVSNRLGYLGDVLIRFLLRNVICELQIVLAKVEVVRGRQLGGHDSYNVVRSISALLSCAESGEWEERCNGQIKDTDTESSLSLESLLDESPSSQSPIIVRPTSCYAKVDPPTGRHAADASPEGGDHAAALGVNGTPGCSIQLADGHVCSIVRSSIGGSAGSARASSSSSSNSSTFDMESYITVWNPFTMSRKLEFLCHAAHVWSLVLLCDGRLCSAASDYNIRVWDAATARCEVDWNMGEVVTSLIQLRDGTICCYGMASKCVFLLRLGRRSCDRQRFSELESCVLALVELVDGSLCSGCEDGTIRLWDMSSGVCVEVFSGHAGCVWSVVQLRDGTICSGSSDCTVRAWNPADGRCKVALSGHAASVQVVAALQDCRVCSGSKDATIRIWNIATENCERVLLGHRGTITSLFQLSDGRVCSGAADKTICLWSC